MLSSVRGIEIFEYLESDEFPLSQEGQQQLRDTLGLQPVDGYEPCEEDYMTAYLNQESVKAALHVNSSINWVDCSRTLRFDCGYSLYEYPAVAVISYVL